MTRHFSFLLQYILREERERNYRFRSHVEGVHSTGELESQASKLKLPKNSIKEFDSSCKPETLHPQAYFPRATYCNEVRE